MSTDLPANMPVNASGDTLTIPHGDQHSNWTAVVAHVHPVHPSTSCQPQSFKEAQARLAVTGHMHHIGTSKRSYDAVDQAGLAGYTLMYWIRCTECSWFKHGL